jgi:hypothetical protein
LLEVIVKSFYYQVILNVSLARRDLLCMAGLAGVLQIYQSVAGSFSCSPTGEAARELES